MGVASKTSPGSALAAKYQALLEHLGREHQAMIAFSGGVDSTFLLRAATEALPGRVRAVIGVSPSLQPDNLELARGVARSLGVELEEVPTHEMERAGYLANAGDRCFHCKTELFSVLRSLRANAGDAVIWDGTNCDDLEGHRPGRRAAEEHGVVSPLADCRWGKDEVRRQSRILGLPTWDRPSTPCLASRVPAGIRVTPEALQRVYEAERVLRHLGFPGARVRDHGATARLEAPLPDLPRLLEARVAVVAGLHAIGYRFVTLDLEGYRPSGGDPINEQGPETFEVGDPD